MTDLLNQAFGESGGLVAEIAGAAVIVLVALAALIWLVRQLPGLRLRGIGRGRVPRLAVVDAASIDGRRRLVLVRRDNVEHLILIGGPSDIVVEGSIVRSRPRALQPVPAPATAAHPARAAPPSTVREPTAAASVSPPPDAGPPLPFPFSRIPPSSSPANGDGNGMNGSPGGGEPSFAQPATRFAPSGEPPRGLNGRSDAAMPPPRGPLPSSYATLGADLPAPAKPANPSATPPEAAAIGDDSAAGEEALKRVSELEAEMNRLLGQISVERRSS